MKDATDFLTQDFTPTERAFFRRILDDHAIFTATDPRGRLVEASEKFYALSGWSPSEILGQTHAVLKSGMHPPEFYRALWETISHGRIWRGVICNRAKQGHFFWFLTTIGPAYDHEGRHVGYLALHSDITREKLAEMVLQEERAMISALREGAAFADAVRLFLERMERIRFPLRLSVLDHRTDGRLYHVAAPRLPDVYTQAVDGIRADPGVGSCGEAAATGEPVLIADIKRHRNWQSYPDLVSMLRGGACWSWPIFGEGRRVLGTVAAYCEDSRLPDENERFLLEALSASLSSAFLWRDSRRVEQRSRERERFLLRRQQEILRLLAHELRTPLNHVLGFASLLQQRLKDPGLRDWARAIEAGGRALLAKVRSCEDLLKPPRAEAPLPLSVRACLDKAVARWLTRHTDRSAPPVSAEGDLFVAMDGHDLDRVLDHLLDNIGKFTEPDCAVFLSAARDGDEVVLRIEDEGPGMDGAMARGLLDIFTVGDNDLTRVADGMGLGLAAARHLVQRNGGSLEIDTAPGKGFRVTIRLPSAPMLETVTP